MDPTSAALLGTTIGVIGTLAAATVNPLITARHARRQQHHQRKREAYETAMAAIGGYAALGHTEGIASTPEFVALRRGNALVELYGSQAAREAMLELISVIHHVNMALENKLPPALGLPKRSQREIEMLDKAFQKFRDAAREDLGHDL